MSGRGEINILYFHYQNIPQFTLDSIEPGERKGCAQGLCV